MNEAKEIYNLIVETGKEFNLSHCGMLAMDTMRMETGYLHWGHDISPEENQYQSGLEFTISFKKKINFIGKKALQKISEKNQDRKFVMFTLKNSKPGNPLLLHDEPIYRDNKIIGYTTSSNFSFCYKKNMCLAYVKGKIKQNEVLYVEVEGRKYALKLEKYPLHDPTSELMRS